MYLVLNKRTIIIVIISLVLVIFVTFACKQFIHAANTNWGLGFGKPGEQPTGNATAEFLKQYDSYFITPTRKKTCIFDV